MQTELPREVSKQTNLINWPSPELIIKQIALLSLMHVYIVKNRPGFVPIKGR